MKYLKKLKFLFIIAVLLSVFGKAKAQEQLVFEYDAAGNQIKRQWICINCTAAQIIQVDPKVLDALEKSLLATQDTSGVFRSLKAFPNPVAESLTVEWSANTGVFIKSIEVYSLSGVRVHSSSYTSQQFNTSIPFLSLPAGGYLLRALYSDGKREIIKLIKQ